MKWLNKVFLLLLLSSSVNAFELRQVDISLERFFSGGVDPLVTQNGLPNRTMGERLALNVNTTFFKYFYWDNYVHGTTDRYLDSGSAGQFRSVGLQMRLGINLFDNVQIGYKHHSQHTLDTTYINGPWPREDSIELKFILLSNKTSRASFF